MNGEVRGERGRWKEGRERKMKGRGERGVEGGRGEENLKSEGQEGKVERKRL